MNIVPVLLVKNEEVWIGRILTALVSVFPQIIVCDTGSTDSTINEISQVSQACLAKQQPPIFVLQQSNNSPRDLTACRQLMQDEAKHLFDATHIFLVDGDELYTTQYLRSIADNPMPDNALSGFTSGIECGELENGELWFYGNKGNLVGLNRQAIIPVGSRWKGEYPFESPDCYVPGSPLNHYFPIPEGSRGFYHLHHTRRSRLDADVYLRVEKKDQFSMRHAPELVPQLLWLKSEKEYRDE